MLQDDELAAIPQRISQFQESVNQLQSKLSLIKNLQPLWLRYTSSQSSITPGTVAFARRHFLRYLPC